MANDIISNQPKGVLRLLLRPPIWLYSANLGWLMSGLFLILKYTGRKSGKPRQVVLKVVAREASAGEYSAAVAWRGKADWFKNIQADPDVQVNVGTRTFIATAFVIDQGEAAVTFLDYACRYPLAFRELAQLMLGKRLPPPGVLPPSCSISDSCKTGAG